MYRSQHKKYFLLLKEKLSTTLLSYNKTSPMVLFLINHTYSIILRTLCRHLHGGLTSWWNMQRRFSPSMLWTWTQRWKFNLRTAGIVFLSSSCLMTTCGSTVRTPYVFVYSKLLLLRFKTVMTGTVNDK